MYANVDDNFKIAEATSKLRAQVAWDRLLMEVQSPKIKLWDVTAALAAASIATAGLLDKLHPFLWAAIFSAQISAWLYSRYTRQFSALRALLEQANTRL